MPSTFTTYSSKQLGGLVIEETFGNYVHRALLRTDGRATVYQSHDGGKFRVISHSKLAKDRAMRMLEGAKAVCWAAT